MTEAFPRILVASEIHFDVAFALSQIPKSVWQDVRGKDRQKSEKALALVADATAARFDRYQVRGPAPMSAP